MNSLRRMLGMSALALAVVPFVLLYTTFFTNPKGLGTGTSAINLRGQFG